VFSNTTVLIPLKNVPTISWNISDPAKEDPGFIPFTPSEIVETKESKKINLYVIGAVVGLFLAFVVLAGVSVYWKAKNTRRGIKLDSSGRRSAPSCLSPDLIAVMLKYSLTSYTVEELSRATKVSPKTCSWEPRSTRGESCTLTSQLRRWDSGMLEEPLAFTPRSITRTLSNWKVCVTEMVSTLPHF